LIESNRKRPTLFRRLGGRLYGDAALCALIYIGCANADFGRVRASIWTDGIHAWVGRDAARRAGAPISQFYLTEDEILLRDLAYPLIEPPYDRQRWYSVLGEWGMTHYFKPEWYHCDPTAYAAQMMGSYVRSESTRYFRLNDDIRNDVVRIEPFVAVARRVLDMDSKREKSLAYVPVLSGPEVANAKARIGENFLTIAWVQKSLADRAASYRFALERLVIAVPTPAAVATERSLALLQSRIAASVLVTPPDFGVAVAGPVPPPRVIVSK
jgi:hypothetical protein